MYLLWWWNLLFSFKQTIALKSTTQPKLHMTIIQDMSHFIVLLNSLKNSVVYVFIIFILKQYIAAMIEINFCGIFVLDKNKFECFNNVYFLLFCCLFFRVRRLVTQHLLYSLGQVTFSTQYTSSCKLLQPLKL